MYRFKNRFLCQGILAIALVIYFVFVYQSDVHADVGAKPSITLTVTGATEDYYVALLSNRSEVNGENSALVLEHVNETSVEAYLENFRNDGWYFFQSPVGKNIQRSNTTNQYHFSYMVPNPFRVIVIGSDGSVYLSEELGQKEYNADCTYDIATGSLTEQRTGKVLERFLYTMVCLVFTLILELAIFRTYKYPFSKRNICCVLLINILTNVPYNYLVLYKLTGLGIMVTWIWAEILIALMEGLFYSFTLRDREGNIIPGRNFRYAVAANAFSAVMGAFCILCFMSGS